ATSAYVSGADGASESKKLTQGSLSGLNALVQTYAIESIGTSLVDAGQVTLTQSFEVALVPIFQFAVFYHDDLWTQPIFDMDVTGRVHVNGDMHMQDNGKGRTLAFHERVTCSGDINYGLPSGTYDVGDVGFYDNNGNYVSMKKDGKWLDASSSDWYTEASARWGGMVQDKAFGQGELTLPMAANGDPHDLIERADGGNKNSFEDKADLKIMDGRAYVKSGSIWQDVTVSMTSSGILTTDASVEFYDAREKKTISNTQIDMNKLSSNKYFPSNGVIYISDQRSTTGQNGTSLVNGAEIGQPLTVACENPLYVQGDFNTINKQPVAGMADAVTYLSNSWNAADSKSSYKNRNASKTSVNMAFVTGDVEPSKSNYGGGLENLPRFLENWNGTEFNYTGSMIQGWRSEQAKGTWRYTDGVDPYYSAPKRVWSFDTDFEDPSKLPPDSPTIQLFQRTGWSQQNVGYTVSNSDATVDVVE
ncbi:MAG: hypothetical protein GY865_13700, partial [candidate division Zixibacteria bacterium]|nr:hypothetical protein [candidate division Zixibacteria bacterium]